MRLSEPRRSIKLCLLSDIEDGNARGFDPGEFGRDRIFVVRRGQGFSAWFNACPHRGYQGASMAWRKDAYLNGSKDAIVCSGHGAWFDIESGVCLSGPCPGEGLKKADVRLAEDGYLYWNI